MKKSWKQWFGMKNLVLFFLILWGFTLFSSFLNEYTRPRVEAVHAGKSALSIVLEGEGQVEWKERNAVFANFGGMVSQVLASEGEEVTAETILFRLDLEKLQKQIQDLEKSQSEWELKLQAAEKREAGFFQEERIEKQNTYWSELAEAEQTLNVQKQLYKLGSVSKQEMEAAQQALNKKRTEKIEVEASLQEKEAQVLVSRREAEEKVQEIQEELQWMRKRLTEKGQVRAEENGVLVQFPITVGAEIQKDQLLFELAKKSEYSEVVYSIGKKKAEYFKVGDFVNLKHASVTNSFQGEILSIRMDTQNSDNRLMKIQFPTGEIPAGSQVILKHAKRTETYDAVVPKSALGQYQNQSFVWVVKEKKKGFGTEVTVQRQMVIVGESDEKNVAIASGLSSEDYYVSMILNEKSLEENMKVIWEREE